ncbi:MAG: HypC/HybG/HupF family hydrogenase formation chaperone [Candidatus Omnitrophica bacterium]|nr:HypC/HybG/HupF family hydrogenase formation chaperone [Candidatus Omnitrophota bacterium]MBU1047329.1 HypC/HybG/HupF family hydrogenase formation chaperone [Candidatus Omnitrophota bacterium]MBU1630656.1 HypC/HybG/HupF family hydrogenase formation chaperone [Candidatus Omnitrophota bacterium]MBU1767767.1 HypC/HybG/HupF family hydrogenase formation chaperone [Candidatus Omnitrophota bacterium]MBU1889086.1 HypC/HybG/HupF family hydrogenase formation chaperone [Candidatus Omnitrophota bacterium
MCLAIPMRVLEIDGPNAVVELGGVKKNINMGLLDNVEVGEYVIVHAGFAIQKVDEKEAKETIEILKEMAK